MPQKHCGTAQLNLTVREGGVPSRHLGQLFRATMGQLFSVAGRRLFNRGVFSMGRRLACRRKVSLESR